MIGKNIIKVDDCVAELPGFNRGLYYNPTDVVYITSTDEITDEPYAKLYIVQGDQAYLDILMVWDGEKLHSTRTFLSQV